MTGSFKTLLLRGFLAALIWFVGHTTRLVRINWNVIETLDREGRPYLLGLWHNNVVSGVYTLGANRYPAIISRSRDGEHINWVMERFGFRGLRGSASRGGSNALRQSLRMLSQGRAVVITPDGPLGPRYEVKPGIVGLARKKGVPVVPICFSARRRWELATWDRVKMPKPFSTVYLLVGTPIRLGKDGTDAEADRLALQRVMRRQVRLAEAFSGADAVFHDPLLEEDG